MLAKKRTKEDEGLHSDETVYEYQNRCLTNKVREQKDEILQLKNNVETLKSQNNFLSKAFMEINCKLLIMEDSIGMLIVESDMAVEKNQTDQNFISLGLNLLNALKGDLSSKEKLAEEHASMLENIKDKIESIAGKLSNGFSSFPKSENISAQIEQKFIILQNELNSKHNELSILKSDKTDFSVIIKQKEAEIANLKIENSNLNRRIIVNPLVPLIKYTKDHFANFIKQKEHTCCCHVCGTDFVENSTNSNMIIDNNLNNMSNSMGNNLSNNLTNNMGNNNVNNSNGNINISSLNNMNNGNTGNNANLINELNELKVNFI